MRNEENQRIGSQILRYGRDRGRLPNLIIIGAMKAGTSSLHYYLDQHPDIQMSRIKELRFFIEERNWSRGTDWYESHFSSSVPIAGETTPAYTHFPFRRGVPQRMHQVIPDAKLIYMVRDPIERAVSNYVHQVVAGRESRPIEEAMASPDESYVTRSRYFMQIEQYLEFFPPERILIVNTLDLYGNRAQTLREVFRFIGVHEDFTSPGFDRVRGESRGKREPTQVGTKILQFLDGSLSTLPSEARDLIKRPLLYPFSRPMSKPELTDSARMQLRGFLVEDINRFREWTDNPLTGWTI